MPQCVVLAGGLGTRLGGLTRDLPKALIPVAGRPFLDHQLRLLARQGFTSIVCSIGYRGEMIREFAGDGSEWGLRIAYADEGTELRGTGGALRVALDAGLLEPSFALVYGDSYLPIDVAPVAAAFEASGAPALMTVLRNEGRWDASNARYQDGRVVRYEKGVEDPELRWVDYGLSWLRADLVAERIPPSVVVDLAAVLGELSAQGLLAGYEVHERFYEIGSPAGLAELEALLAAPGAPGP